MKLHAFMSLSMLTLAIALALISIGLDASVDVDVDVDTSMSCLFNFDIVSAAKDRTRTRSFFARKHKSPPAPTSSSAEPVDPARAARFVSLRSAHAEIKSTDSGILDLHLQLDHAEWMRNTAVDLYYAWIKGLSTSQHDAIKVIKLPVFAPDEPDTSLTPLHSAVPKQVNVHSSDRAVQQDDLRQQKEILELKYKVIELQQLQQNMKNRRSQAHLNAANNIAKWTSMHGQPLSKSTTPCDSKLKLSLSCFNRQKHDMQAELALASELSLELTNAQFDHHKTVVTRHAQEVNAILNDKTRILLQTIEVMWHMEPQVHHEASTSTSTADDYGHSDMHVSRAHHHVDAHRDINIDIDAHAEWLSAMTELQFLSAVSFLFQHDIRVQSNANANTGPDPFQPRMQRYLQQINFNKHRIEAIKVRHTHDRDHAHAL